ncbi:nucleoside transporter like protein [Zymoseptoria brevis]|uniref:Nucleoside transporter like protein n=1 Tax=Zymoseptoria brevis TaxID=1047168 RepID=A0A0F4GSD9_9PEZI|nr:nucleoside transporter like protein [Zymoseptoria brevis]
MSWDEEKQHGLAEEIITEAPSQLPQRPLTTQEKLEATRFDSRTIHSRDTSSSNNDFGPHVQPATDILARLRNIEATLDRRLGVESEAIDRKLPEDRKPQPWHAQLNMALIWASGTMNISCFATGFIGWQFGLSLKQSILITVFGSLLGGAVSGFCATMGAPTGLRQISISRYSFGWYPNKIVAALNTIQQLGWSAAGCITGGLALTAVSNGRVSVVVGIIIIATCSLVISFIGLRAILVYEKYAWFIYLIVFLIIFGQVGPHADNATPSSLNGADLSGAVLSVLAIVYGSSAAWATIASDYYVQYSVDVSRTKVFLMTTFGIALPTSVGMVAGCVVSSAMNNNPSWKSTYEDQGLGYLIADVLHPSGFASFILVLLVLSVIGTNVLALYSAGLSCQQFARPFAKVPRFLWTLACFGVIIALALAGRDSLLAYLQNFLSLLGYWCTSYFVIVFSEHFVFRKGDFANYDLEGWNTPARLPVGWAGLTAFGLGVVVWVMGMVQTWFVGPIARTIGTSGGDVSNQLCFVVTLVSYVPARWLEYRFVGR